MSSKNEQIRREIYEILDQFDKLKVTLKEKVKELPQNGETAPGEDLAAALELLEIEIQNLASEGKSVQKITGEDRFKKLLRAFNKIKRLRQDADVEALLHARGNTEE